MLCFILYILMTKQLSMSLWVLLLFWNMAAATANPVLASKTLKLAYRTMNNALFVWLHRYVCGGVNPNFFPK